MEETPHQYDFNYEKEFSNIITNKLLTNEQKNQLTYIKLLLEKRLQLESEYKRKYQEIQLKYEKKFQKNYETRNKLITGELLPELTYPFYLQYPITPIKDLPLENGIPEFWLRCIENSDEFTPILSEHDCLILKHLIKLTCETDEGGDYTFTFTFNSNSYFSNNELKLSYIFDKKKLMLTEIKGTEISWRSKEKNPTLRSYIFTSTYSPIESFFYIFSSIKKEKQTNDEKPSIVSFHEVEDLGCHIKEDLIPNAIEYYLGLIDNKKQGNYYRGYDPYDYYDERELDYLNSLN